jgi:hypothetical protein
LRGQPAYCSCLAASSQLLPRWVLLTISTGIGVGAVTRSNVDT